MEELLQLDHPLAQQLVQSKQRGLGEPWHQIHAQMQNALVSTANKSQNKMAYNSRTNLAQNSYQQTRNLAKVDRMPFVKQARKHSIKKPLMKLKTSEAEFGLSQALLKESMANEVTFKVIDMVLSPSQRQLELKENETPNKRIKRDVKVKSMSDTKESTNSKKSIVLSKTKEVIKQRSSINCQLVFPQLIEKNTKTVQQIYKSQGQSKQGRILQQRGEIDLKLSKGNDIHQKNHQTMVNEPESCIQSSRVNIMKTNEIFFPIGIPPKASSQKNQNLRKTALICLTETGSRAYTRIKIKSIHSLDHKKVSIRAASMKQRHQSLQNDNSSVNKKSQHSLFHRKEQKNIIKDLHSLKQIKYRLFLNPTANKQMR